MKLIWLVLLLCLPVLALAETDHSWSLTDANDSVHQFPQDAVQKQQVTVLLFWATWCPYCKQLMPHIQSALYQYQDDLNLKVYALNIKEDGDPEAYLNSNGHNFLLFPNADEVAKLYAVHGTPAVLIFDQNGHQVFDLRSVKTEHLVKQSATHGAKSVRLAPHWAVAIRKALQQLHDEA